MTSSIDNEPLPLPRLPCCERGDYESEFLSQAFVFYAHLDSNFDRCNNYTTRSNTLNAVKSMVTRTVPDDCGDYMPNFTISGGESLETTIASSAETTVAISTNVPTDHTSSIAPAASLKNILLWTIALTVLVSIPIICCIYCCMKKSKAGRSTDCSTYAEAASQPTYDELHSNRMVPSVRLAASSSSDSVYSQTEISLANGIYQSASTIKHRYISYYSSQTTTAYQKLTHEHTQ